MPILNAKDMHADVSVASREHFSAPYTVLELQKNSTKLVTSDDGDMIKKTYMIKTFNQNTSAV